MNKHRYRAKKVSDINWSLVKEKLAGSTAVLAVDVAKEKQYALLSTPDNTVSELWHWQHPEQTREVREALMGLESLRCPLTVVMESTSTYGDTLRYQFRCSGFEVNQISAKRVFDAREIYDGTEPARCQICHCHYALAPGGFEQALAGVQCQRRQPGCLEAGVRPASERESTTVLLVASS